MPKYYHISKESKKNENLISFNKTINQLDTIINSGGLYFSKRNQSWYNKMHHLHNRCKYELYIPSSCFTTSFNARKPNSIFKLTNINVSEYKSRLKKCKCVRKDVFKENPNIIGMDLTAIEQKLTKIKHSRTKKGCIFESELILFKVSPDMELSLINCIDDGTGADLFNKQADKRLYDLRFPVDS